MPYKMNPQQYKAVLALSSADRSTHFIGRVADWEQLWGVKNADGWLIPATSDGIEYFPVWPHPEYAERITDEYFPGHQATEIALNKFLTHWLPTLEKDNVKVAVFPNEEWTFWVMKPSDLAQCLRDESALYD